MDDLDFSRPGGPLKPPAPREPQAPIDIPAVARAFFESAGKAENISAGAVVERVGPGGVFGEMALVDQSPRSANAAAETDCALLALNRNVFLNLVRSNPTFGIALLGSMAARVRNTAAAVS